jgi:hypothetical protein
MIVAFCGLVTAILFNALLKYGFELYCVIESIL